MTLNVIASCIIAQSPITLNNSNMPGSGDTLRYTNAQINSVGNYTQTGINFNWNFSNLVSTTEGVRNYKLALQTPYFLFFAPTEYGEKIADTIGAGPLTATNYYNFYKKQTNPNAYIADGVGMTFSSVPAPSYYSDKDELYNFPMTYSKYDSTTFKFTTTTAGIIPFSYSKVGYRVTKVDGWGSITTPYGTDNCLRLITTQYAMDSIKNSIVPIPLGFPNYQRSYQWLTATSKIPFLEITGNLIGTNFTITQVRYRGYNKNPLPTGIKDVSDLNSLSLYPNPVKNKLYLDKKFVDTYSLEIYDLSGKLIQKRDVGVAEKLDYLDVSTYEKGLYILKVTQGAQERYFKFIKME